MVLAGLLPAIFLELVLGIVMRFEVEDEKNI